MEEEEKKKEKEEKRSSSGHSRKCQGVVQSATNTGWGNCRQEPRALAMFRPTYWTIVLYFWTICGKMSHGKSRAHVMLSGVFINTPPYLSQVTALATWHKSSISLNLTEAMNNLIGGIIISSYPL